LETPGTSSLDIVGLLDVVTEWLQTAINDVSPTLLRECQLTGDLDVHDVIVGLYRLRQGSLARMPDTIRPGICAAWPDRLESTTDVRSQQAQAHDDCAVRPGVDEGHE
jgi:hypothetical protein